VVVMEGLAANERVVLAGQMLVRPGSKVRIAPGNPANGSGKENAQGGGY